MIVRNVSLILMLNVVTLAVTGVPQVAEGNQLPLCQISQSNSTCDQKLNSGDVLGVLIGNTAWQNFSSITLKITNMATSKASLIIAPNDGMTVQIQPASSAVCTWATSPSNSLSVSGSGECDLNLQSLIHGLSGLQIQGTQAQSVDVKIVCAP